MVHASSDTVEQGEPATDADDHYDAAAASETLNATELPLSVVFVSS